MDCTKKIYSVSVFYIWRIWSFILFTDYPYIYTLYHLILMFLYCMCSLYSYLYIIIILFLFCFLCRLNYQNIYHISHRYYLLILRLQKVLFVRMLVILTRIFAIRFVSDICKLDQRNH
eukprot:484788_1